MANGLGEVPPRRVGRRGRQVDSPSTASFGRDCGRACRRGRDRRLHRNHRLVDSGVNFSPGGRVFHPGWDPRVWAGRPGTRAPRDRIRTSFAHRRVDGDGHRWDRLQRR